MARLDSGWDRVLAFGVHLWWQPLTRRHHGLVVGVLICRLILFLYDDTRGVTGPVRDCLRTHVRARTFHRRQDDDLRACTLNRRLRVHVSLSSLRVLPLVLVPALRLTPLRPH